MLMAEGGGRLNKRFPGDFNIRRTIKVVKNKKNGIVLVMALLLLIGGAWGSYAWFKAKQSTSPNLVISVGSFKLEDKTGDDTWTILNAPINGEAKEGEVDGSFSTVRPGDSFKKVFKVQNTGELKQNIDIDVITKAGFANNLVGKIKGDKNLGQILLLQKISMKKQGELSFSEVSTEGTDSRNSINKFELNPNETIEFEVEIILSGENTTVDWQGENIDVVSYFNNTNFINVNATQLKAE